MLFGFAASLIFVRALVLPNRDDEFVLAAGACAVFFTFLTEIHGRYLYPTVVLMAIAICCNHWYGLLCISFATVFTRNVFGIADPDNHRLASIVLTVLRWSRYWNGAFTVILTLLLLAVILYPLYLFVRQLKEQHSPNPVLNPQ
jgi:hypothetical protein